MHSSASEENFDVVLVAYNSAEVISDAIKSVPRGADIVVVDNDSSDDSAALAERAGANVLRQGKNLGFGCACNVGARIGRRPFILFLNPDARLSSGTLQDIASAFEGCPELAAINPSIRSPDGRQYSPGHAIVQGIAKLAPLPDHDADVVTLSGSVLAVRRSAFEAVGGFDESIFLYYEDDDLSKRLRDAGYKLRHLSGTHVLHMNGKSTVFPGWSRDAKSYENLRSLVYVIRKHAVLNEISAVRRRLLSRFVRRILTLHFSDAAYMWRLRAFLGMKHDGRAAPKRAG